MPSTNTYLTGKGFEMKNLDLEDFARVLAPPVTVRPAGDPADWHYIPVGLGWGFYIPEKDFQFALEQASLQHRIWFVANMRDGRVKHSTSRDALYNDPHCNGEIAWIHPNGS